MARIPEPEIERPKSEVSVERLVASSGIELKKSGKDWLGRCPFHEDDTASLMVTPGKNQRGRPSFARQGQRRSKAGGCARCGARWSV